MAEDIGRQTHGLEFVEVGPLDGWTQEEIENEIFGGPAVVLSPFDDPAGEDEGRGASSLHHR